MSDRPKPYASPVCYAHELDPLYRDQALGDDPAWRDISRWRKAERERLRGLRKNLPGAARKAAVVVIEKALSDLLEASGSKIIGAYWPIHGEPDLRAWMRRQAEQGRMIALPVVQAPRQPLKYARWRPGAAMTRGVWGIAEPAAREWLEPDLVIAPLVGIDANAYRLGNGGGYFDRSLATAEPRPLCVGVGFDCARIATIYPQSHDIPMDEVILGPV